MKSQMGCHRLKTQGIARETSYIFSLLIFTSCSHLDVPKKSMNIRAEVIVIKNPKNLEKESLPKDGLRLDDESMDFTHLASFENLVQNFNKSGDSLIDEVFFPLLGRKKYRVQVVITSGIPAPYDAWTAKYKGKFAIFFNLAQWDRQSLNRSGMAVFKHEITHVLLEDLLKPPSHNLESRLNHILLDEGIAHFIGYPEKELLLTEKRTRWTDAEMKLTKARRAFKSKKLSLIDKENLLEKSNTGSYWDKYAAIAGKFRTAKIYEKTGAQGIIDTIKQGQLKNNYTTLLDYGLEVSPLSNNTFVVTDHEFYISNVLIVKMDDGTAVVVSSPFENLGATALMKWVKNTLKPKRIVAINPHFHRDGTGGNAIFKKYGAETWSSSLTHKLRAASNERDPIKSASFYKDPNQKQRIINSPAIPADNTFDINAGKEFVFSGEKVQVFYPGPAHSKDNVVVYFPKRKILFGGCMIKPQSLGYLGDADVQSWPDSARRLQKFDATTVIPGHGQWGGPELISKTIQVSEKASKRNVVK